MANDENLSELCAPSVEVAGRYVLLNRLGEGGMGEVWRAHDLVCNEAVAVKMLRPTIAGAPAAEIRFQREIQAMARLVHPRIVPVLDAGTDPVVGLFFVMTLQLGRPLYEICKEWNDWRQLWPVVDQILDTLAHAHAREVIHRDIKPDNILVNADGQTVLLDFGVARLKDHARSGTSAYDMLGTVDYAAPEQATGSRRRIGPWTDIYCFAIVLYEIICGRLPFWASSPVQALMARLNQGCPPLEPKAGFAIPHGLQQIFNRMMCPDIFQRYGHAAEVRRAMAALVDGAYEVRLATPAPSEVQSQETFPEETTQLTDSEAEKILRSRQACYAHCADGSLVVQAFEAPLRPAPISGRDDLLFKMQRALARWSASPKPGVLALVGEEGIGKSRLAREALYPSVKDGIINVHRHRWRPDTSVREIALSVCGAIGLKPKVFREHLQWWLQGHGLCDALEREQLVEWIMSPAGPTTVETEGRNLAIILRGAASRMKEGNNHKRPFVLLLDDLPYLDPALLTVVWAVHRFNLPVLVLCTTRSVDIVPHLPRPRWLDQGTRVLNRLDDEIIGDILDAMVDCPDENLRAALIAEAQGNPSKLLDALQDRRRAGVLLPAYPRWIITPPEWEGRFTHMSAPRSNYPLAEHPEDSLWNDIR